MRFSRVSPDQDFQEKEWERKVRRRIFHLIFAILALTLGGFLTWKLSSLVLPIIVGALLAFLFRPVKERFKIPWLPHELQVLCSFAAIGLVLFCAFGTARNHIPDDQPARTNGCKQRYRRTLHNPLSHRKPPRNWSSQVRSRRVTPKFGAWTSLASSYAQSFSFFFRPRSCLASRFRMAEIGRDTWRMRP